MLRNAVLTAGGGLWPFVAPIAVFAQAPAPPPETSAQDAAMAAAEAAADQPRSSLEDIVVTAQRRAQNQQDVPISITTITAASLANSGVRSTNELIATTSGVVITTQQRAAQIFVRGIGTQSVNPGDENNVATYVDGVYYASSYGNIMSFNNVDRVELLKGPQGTLFGRNATGGLVHVITKDPQPGFAGEVNLSYANYDTIEGSGYISGGDDKIAADFAIYGIHQGKGWGRNLTTGQQIYRSRDLSMRSKLLFTPTDIDRFTIIFDWSENNSDQGVTRGAFPGAVMARPPGTTLPAVVYNGSIYDAIENRQAGPDDISYKNMGASLRYQRELGFADLSVVAAYRHGTQEQVVDVDTGPYAILEFDSRYYDRSAQLEALLNGNTGRLDWTAGAFAYQSEVQQTVNINSEIPAFAAQNSSNTGRQNTTSYSAFAQGTYELFDGTRLTLGGRYTTDRRELYARRVSLPGHPLGVGVQTLLVNDGRHKSWSKLTYRVGLDQKLGDDILLYGSYSRGFKSGTYNTSDPTSPPVNPETLDAAEIGIKSELFDRTLRFNVSAFHYKYKDIQLSRSVFDPVRGLITQLLNAARATSKGIEVDAAYAPRLPFGRLELRAGLSVLDATYDDFPGAPITTPRGQPAGGNATTPGDAAGFRMIRSPKWTLNLGADFSVPVGPGRLEFNVNYYHNDGFFFEPDNRLKQEAYDLLNGQVAYSFGEDDKYRVRVFGRNITKAKYYLSLQEGSFGDLLSPQAPRTYGVGFDAKF